MGIPAIRKNFNNKGVTIIEIMIVIAICGILAAITTGPLLLWRANKVVDDCANTLITDIERAKVEAIRRNVDVTIRFLNDANAETTTNFTQYRVTWTFTPKNPPGSDQEKILWERTMDSRITSTANVATITFTPRGIVRGATTGDYKLSSAGRADLKRRITVSRLSLITVTTF